MCGIFTIFNSSKTIVKDLDAMAADAMMMVQIRGTDSTGIGIVDKNWDVGVYKKTMNATDFLHMPTTRRTLLEAPSAFALFIHGRKATAGGVIEELAHPFMIPNKKDMISVIGTHNGTLTNWDRKKFDSDSQWFFHELAEKGSKILTTVTGDYTVTWSDLELSNNHMATNGKRPLFYAFLKGSDVLVAASEPEIISWSAKRNGIHLEDNKIFMAEPDFLYTIPMDNVKGLKKDKIVRWIAPVATRTPSSAWNGNQGQKQKTYQEEQKEGIIRATKNIFNEGTIPSAVFCPDITANERNKFFELTGLSSRLVQAKPAIYDEIKKTYYFDVDSYKGSAQGIAVRDTILVRNVTEDFAAIVDKLETVPLVLSGYCDDPEYCFIASKTSEAFLSRLKEHTESLVV